MVSTKFHVCLHAINMNIIKSIIKVLITLLLIGHIKMGHKFHFSTQIDGLGCYIG